MKSNTYDLRVAHGVLMTFGWAVFALVAIFIARFGKHWGHSWFIAHVTLNTIAVACILAAFVIAIVMSSRSFNQVSLYFES